MKIANYTTREKLSAGKKFTVYRAIDEKDNQSYILKVLDKKTARDFNMIHTLKQELHHIRQIDSEYVIKAVGPFDPIEDKDYSAIVLEDIAGKSLKDYIKENRPPFEPPQFTRFIQLALGITKGLAAIHHQNIIHKDINPTNIIWNPSTNRLKIIDFNIATQFDIKVPYTGNPEKLQGTLPYISPEQTGRMNRRVDHRTDFYSLGATFYELLTGKLPFGPGNPMEIVYAHLARDPLPPHTVNPEIPPILSQIILKLLAKNPEERYQSAVGLIHDLEKAAQGNFPGFIPGEKDFPGKLQVPEKLYGRENEIQQLLDTYQAVCAGKKQVILVTGYPGTGKTSLVNEIHKPVTRGRGYFINGKFDQMQRSIPYFAFIQALNQLCGLLLTEPQEILAQWQEHILHSLGNLGKVLTDIIPQLEAIIGKQPDIPEVGGDEAKKRFNYVFQCFLQAVCSEAHPLVIFIDDMQWADLASLGLLHVLAEDRQSRYLLFIGAYRDNEVSPLHPLITTIEEIRQLPVDIHTIHIQNLSWENTREWLGDTLKTGRGTEFKGLPAFTDLIYKKTHGNAFFTAQFLENLYKQNLLRFDFHQARWQWNLKQIEKQNFTDNVVDLLVNKIKTLPETCREVLKLAACIGGTFNLETLAVISGQPAAGLEKQLEMAQAQHLVYPLQKDVYKFVHDRIYQAAYTLIPGESRKILHLETGRLLLKNFAAAGISHRDNSLSSSDGQRNVFEIVNHLNTGIELIDTAEEKWVLAGLNLEAGRQARMSAAYQPGAVYIETAVGLLPPDCWQSHYDLALAVYNEAIQTSYLCGKFREMENYIEIVTASARESAHKTTAYECRIMGLTVQNRESLAAQTLVDIFRHLGVNIPAPAEQDRVNEIYGKTQAMLEQKGLESLKDLPLASDPQMQLVMRLFNVGIGAIIFGAQELLPITVIKMTGLIFEYGLTPETPSILSIYGIIKVYLNDIPAAYQLGEIAQDLLTRKIGSAAIEVRTMVAICLYLAGNKQHFKRTCKQLMDTYPTALDVGDSEYAGYILANYIVFLTRTDMELKTWKEKVQDIQEKIIQLKQSILLGALSMELSVNANLSGENSHPAVLKTELDAHLDTMDKGSAILFRCHINIKRTILAYLFEAYDHISDYIHHLEENWKLLTTPLTYLRSDYYFYVPLAYMQLYALYGAAGPGKESYLEKAREGINMMKAWAEFGPVNFLHKYYLLLAEWHRVTGEQHEAAEYYDKAIETAFENEYINEAALANELAAKFYMRQNRRRLAAVYFLEARDCYRKWGALAKVKHLEENYPGYLSIGVPAAKLTTATISSASTDTTDELLDVKSIIKASQALSGEMQLKNLLEKMMHILIENAGAQKGLFIENTGGRLLLQAEGISSAEGVSGILGALPVEESGKLPLSVVNYVARTRKKLVFDNIARDPNYYTDPYIQANQPRSVVCFPILRHDELSALIYLENNRVEGAFTPARVEVINTLSAQVAISMENARIYRDLEELNKSLERKVRERTLQLEEMDKAKSRFFANISHEFRTPLTLIMGPLEKRLSQCQDKKDSQDGQDNQDSQEIRMMLRNSRRLLNLVNQLLELARLDSGKMKLEVSAQNIIPFLKNIVMCFESLAERGKVNLLFHHRESDITLYFDPEKLEKIMTNLLSNAFNYTPAGGSVRVTVTVQRCGGNGSNDRFPAGSVEIIVRDTGTGIPRDRLPHIFERFYRGEGVHEYKGKGSGIGLALTRELVELHRGEIEVQSSCRDDETRGSEFKLRLPLGGGHLQPDEIVTTKNFDQTKSFDQTFTKVWPPAGPPEARKSTAEEIPAKEAKVLVLVVEDNADVRSYIKSTLEPQYKVLEAADGGQGIRRARETIPDIIISDVMMPGVDGFQMSRELKSDILTCHIPVILLTAKVSEESILQGLETGADDYITKPFSTVLLEARVRNLVELRRRLQMESKNRMAFQPWEITVSPLDDAFYQNVQDIIEKNLSDPDFGVEALCRGLGMSQATVYRKLHAMTGQSPTLFLRTYRMKRAAQLLRAGAGSVAEIAGRVGFTDRSYFARCFKEQFQCLPSNIQTPGAAGSAEEIESSEKVYSGPEAAGAVLQKSSPGSRKQETILLVEDSEDAREYIRGVLAPGYQVIEAVDGNEGLARAMEIIPDLIISDIMMPGLDGYELCRVLKQDIHTSHIPVILLTARAEEESRVKGLETGADDYITKPFNSQILRARIKNLVQLRRDLQEKRNREMALLPVQIAEPELDREFMKELNTVIEQNLADPGFNVEQLAKKLYMSSATLYRKVQALSGEIPSGYIRTYRLRRAAQLFKENFGSVTEVAFEVGFNSRAYFTKCFKEQYHRLPSVYLSAEAE